MKILILTDSLGLPREKPEVVSYNETWVYKLSQEHNVHQLSLGGGVMSDFIKQLAYIQMFNPDMVVLQLGIVDCAPRALTKFENEFINRFRITRKLANKYLPKYSGALRKKRRIAYTNTFEFENGLKQISEAFSCKVLCLSILEPSEEYESNLPGITEKVSTYNNILKKVLNSGFLDVSSIKKEMIMTDNIHLNNKGHEFIYQLLNKNNYFEK